MRFSLAAIVIESDPFVPAERFLSFKNGKKANVQITLSSTSFRHEGVDERYCADGISVYFLPGKGWLFEEQSTNHGAQILASADYGRLRLHQPATVSGEISMRLLRLPLECRFVHEGVLSLHAACVEVGGRAVCFTGDSGIGKSTRAQAHGRSGLRRADAAELHPHVGRGHSRTSHDERTPPESHRARVPAILRPRRVGRKRNLPHAL